MSATESTAELLDRLAREREFESLREKARARAPKPVFRRPAVPAPLRLPPRAPRAAQPQPRRRSSPPAATPPRPPLPPGVHPARTKGYRHPVKEWWWDAFLAVWIGRCPVCHERFVADSKTAARLEQEAARYADANPVSPHPR